MYFYSKTRFKASLRAARFQLNFPVEFFESASVTKYQIPVPFQQSLWTEFKGILEGRAQ